MGTNLTVKNSAFPVSMEASSIVNNSTTHPNTSMCNLYSHHQTASIALPIVYTVISIVGIFGNGLAIVAIRKKQKKINSTTLYSMNLVISDIFFAAVLPARIVYYARGFNWPFGEAMCRITAVICYSNIYASVSFMTCLSLDRLLAVIYPFRHSKFRNVRNVKKICTIVWIIILCQTVPLLLVQMSKLAEGNFLTCMEYPNFEDIPSLPQMLLGACVIGYVCPVAIMLFCYSKVSSKLFRSAKENPLTEKSGRNKKANNVILLVLFVFFICFTPYHVAIVQHMIKKLQYEISCQEQQNFQIALHVTVSVMNFNCCLDPFIYFFACKGYRAIVLKMFKQPVSVSISSGVKTTPDNFSPGAGNFEPAIGTTSDTNL
ncbi:G-protein coupled receptor 183-like [Stegostoma tigrinum]|uniref:G-protein coupled receptor 183-like n=1 Tax=Stegostoma tigrinum TaxID=3053191 RepID=UPI00202ACC6F|nr:G-protein coupled receptor 183-like [Stegostoma tigrinum]XP_059502448.1 G-protein coupled receptor 183-like [Stegostoma tigrinum]